MTLRDCAKVLLESGRLSILLLFLILVTYVPLISLALPNWLGRSTRHWLQGYGWRGGTRHRYQAAVVRQGLQAWPIWRSWRGLGGCSRPLRRR